MSSTQELSPFTKATAGSLASVIANFLVYPLDLIKTRIQLQPTPTKAQLESSDSDEVYKSVNDAFFKIYKEEGISGLYSGVWSSLVGTGSTNFAYFWWYSVVRTIHSKHAPSNNENSTFIELLLGAVAGALAQLFTIPVSVITTKQQTSHSHPSFLLTAKEILKTDGAKGFWRGLRCALVLVVNPSITYGAYERFKSIYIQRTGKKSLNSAENFILGALSKSAATVVSQPLIVSKVMVQAKTVPSSSNDIINESKEGILKKPIAPKEFNSFTQSLIYLYKSEGYDGLFKGLIPQLVKGILVQGLLFMFKDQVEGGLIKFLLWFVGIKNNIIGRRNKGSSVRVEKA